MDLQPINLALPESLKDAYNGAADSMRFALNAKEDDDDPELLVMGIVGDKYEGLGADQVVQQLSELKGRRINVRINSPGGLAYDGLTIFNALIQHEGGATATVEGMAGSAASLIAMGGNPVRMMANANMFIHRSMGLSFGNAIVMRDMAEFLDALDDGIVETYVSKTGLSKRRVNQLLDGKIDGTNMTSKEAKNLGFVDEVVELKRNKKASNVTTTPINESPVSFVVPDDPPGGDGAAVTATWTQPQLSDFTADAWENVGPNTRAAIARHFAVVPENLETAGFEELLIPHHDADGQPVKVAVDAGLANLECVPEQLRGDVEAHLTAHLPPDRTLHNEVERRMVELRLMEIGT